VVIALVCIWLGRQVNVVHERRQLLAELDHDTQARFDPRHTAFIPGGGVAEFAGMVEWRGPGVPWYRKVLGDETVTVLALPSQTSGDRRERFQRAFPEAAITYEPPGKPFVSQRSR
jgi:hypothetical protein